MAERAFGPYRLVRQIAVGGMAEIHLAKTRGIAGFEKFVALKMIHPNFAQDEQFIQMLIDEAKIAVQLQHVNVAQTFDLGRVGDTYYITMEFVDGADLYKILRRGSEQDTDIPLDICAYVAKETATGLDYAHRKRDVHGSPLGIVHRDVSPQNVLISYAGEVKLVDFGIAKATMRARQTQVGVIKGKYYYMSPEQAWGDPLDHRSDIFSCGIVLYEMMTGQMLYLEEDLHRLLEMVRRADIAPPTRLRRDVPPQLERIVMHALAKNPSDRYQSANDFATDLERFLHVYSPVFTASKLAAHLRKVVGDPVPMIEPQSIVAPRSPQQATQPMDRRELVHERSEITDENSVIFRMAALQGAPSRERSDDDSTAAELPRGAGRPRPSTSQPLAPIPAPARSRPATQPMPVGPQRSRAPTGPLVPTRVPAQIPTRVPGQEPPRGRPATQPPPAPRTRPATQPPPARPLPQPPTRPPTAPLRPPPKPQPPPRAKTQPPPGHVPISTLALEAGDLAEVEEMTAVSSPPAGLDFGDFEPTMIDAAEARDAELHDHEPHDSEDGPTITRDGAGVPLPQPVALSSSETMPRGHNELRSRIRPGAPAHPAMAASTPIPAVSELRKPHRSRRTPPQGSNVLQQIVQSMPSDPMPTVQLRGGPTSDGVPRSVADGASSGSPTGPQGQVPVGAAQPPPIPPQQYPLPVPYGPPGALPNQVPQPGQPMALVAPPTPPPGSVPVAQLPPHLVQYGGYGLPPVAQVVSPMPGQQGGYPYPYGGAPMSFTKQMQAAIELDDIPQRYKFLEAKSRRAVWAIVIVALFAGGIGLSVLLTRQSEDTPRAMLIIESQPDGATVKIDGEVLPETTPARFATEPGARHEIELTRPGFRTWKETRIVSSSGGEIRIPAQLQIATVKLRIDTKPANAEIYLGDKMVGRTPKTVDNLDPAKTPTVKLVYEGQEVLRTLDWTGKDVIDIKIDFAKEP